MTKKITKTNTKTKNMTKTKTFREHPQRATLNSKSYGDSIRNSYDVFRDGFPKRMRIGRQK